MNREELDTFRIVLNQAFEEHEQREAKQFEAKAEKIIKSFIQSHESGVHHRFIDSMINERRVTEERKNKILTQIWGWGIIVALSGIGTAVYNFFIKNH